MRIAVLIIGILGVALLGTGTYIAGMAFLAASKVLEANIQTFKKNQEQLKAFAKNTGGTTALQLELEAEVSKQKGLLAIDYGNKRVMPFLLGGLILGLFGTIASFKGHGFSGALLLILSGVIPGLIFPLLFLFSCLLPIAGFLSLFVRKPRVEPKVGYETTFEDD